MPKRESKPTSFEQLYAELEATIENLEAGNLSIDQALVLYERGIELAKQCNAMLDNAELRIQELVPLTNDADSDDEIEIADSDEDD